MHPGRGMVSTHAMPGHSGMIIDLQCRDGARRVFANQGAGIRLHQARSAVRCSASHMKESAASYQETLARRTLLHMVDIVEFD